MNEIIKNEKIIVENMIYEIKGKQVMLDTEISVNKCNGNIVILYDIGIPISVCNKLRKELKNDRIKS